MFTRGGYRAAATSKMERLVIIVNYCHKAVDLGPCSSPRSASVYSFTKVSLSLILIKMSTMVFKWQRWTYKIILKMILGQI